MNENTVVVMYEACCCLCRLVIFHNTRMHCRVIAMCN